MNVFDVLWPLPLIALAVYIWHETVAYRRETRAERASFAEHMARITLGYEQRPDHPWSPNETRPQLVEAEGPRAEQTFDGAKSID